MAMLSLGIFRADTGGPCSALTFFTSFFLLCLLAGSGLAAPPVCGAAKGCASRHSAEAFDLCRKTLTREGLPGVSSEELTRWQLRSGLSAPDLCLCAASGVVQRRRAANGDELPGEVMRAAQECMALLRRK